MAKKENQHYVPKFYLKNFSYQNNEKQIGIYNTINNFHYDKASIKHQATKPFFYGKDEKLENQLSKIEDQIAPTLKNIIENNQIENITFQSKLDLLAMTILTDVRNPIPTERIQNALKNLDKYGEEKYGEENYKKILDEKSIKNEKNIGMTLSFLPDILSMCIDLEFKLIVNNTKIPFITSDYPIIRYNQFFERRKKVSGTTGFGCKGLEIFFPISAKNMILFYDHWAYKIGHKKKDPIIIKEENDIIQLNVLQFLNCDKTVFYNQEITMEVIENINRISKKFEKPNQVVLNEHIVRKMSDFKNEKRKVVISNFTNCATKLQFRYAKETEEAKKFKFDNRLVYLRPLAEKIRKNRNEME